MSSWLFTALALLAVPIGLLILRRWRDELLMRHRAQYLLDELPQMPEPLAKGRVLLSEEKLKIRHGERRIYGRVDQIFSYRGLAYPLETKTRRRAQVYLSDRIQLSAQARMLREDRGYRVADVGFVRLVIPKAPVVYKQVQLLSDDEINRLFDRRHAILSGEVAPSPPAHPAVCRSCLHQHRCDAAR